MIVTAAKKTASPKPTAEPVPEPADSVPDAGTDISAPDTGPDLIDVVLPDGTKVQAFADARDDFEILDDVQMIAEGNITRLPALLRRLVPDNDRRILLDKARGKNGRVSIDAASDLIWDLFAGMNNPN